MALSFGSVIFIYYLCIQILKQISMKKSMLILVVTLFALSTSCKKSTQSPTSSTVAVNTTNLHQVKYEFITKNTWQNGIKMGTYKFDYTSDNGVNLTETIVLDTVINKALGVKWTKTVNIAEGSTFNYTVSELSYTDLPTIMGVNRNASVQLNVYIDGVISTPYHGVSLTYFITGTPSGHAFYPHTITSPIFTAP